MKIDKQIIIFIIGLLSATVYFILGMSDNWLCLIFLPSLIVSMVYLYGGYSERKNNWSR